MANNQQLLLGEGAGGGIPNYIEEVFSTYLYTGTGAALTITNNIDLSTKGGLVWLKHRDAAYDHGLFDTARGAGYRLISNSTAAENFSLNYIPSFDSTGFSLGAPSVTTNNSGNNYVSWTFRKQPKFFDIVTYTGNGSARTIAHNLGSAPGMIIIKRTTDLADWWAWHRTFSANEYVMLNSTAAKAAGANSFTSSDSTSFTIGSQSNINGSSNSYVAYLFAHDAGGFGLAGTDNVISCGTFTTDGSGNATVNLGYEPQWLMTKVTSTTGGWRVFDTMRGWSGGIDALLVPNNSGAEYVAEDYGNPTATGMDITNHGASITWIYIAIRRGPMKVPTVGTSVFSPQALNAPANGTQVTTGFPIDLSMFKARDGGPSGQFQDRLRGLPSTAGGGTPALYPDATVAESTNQTGYEFWNTGYRTYTAQNAVWWMFRRAPGFFDEVCYTGTNTDNSNKSHNLGVAPELIILKARSAPGSPYDNWYTWQKDIAEDKYLYLNTTSGEITAPNPTFGPFGTYAQMTATTWRVQNAGIIDRSGETYVAYLFATVAGVSKVGSYTGNGSSQTIACGFAAGSRFVLIKRTDSTGDWYVWDSARGIIAGNDPHLSLNTTAAEVTTDDSVDTDNSGFIVNQLSATNVNVTSATYIFLAIA